MELSIQDGIAKAYKKAGGKNAVLLDLAESSTTSFSSSSFDSDFISKTDIERLIKVMDKHPKYTDEPWKRRELRVLKAVLALKQGKGKRIKNLEVMAGAIREHLMPLPNHWIFKQGFGGQLLPWYIENIEYVPPEKTRDGYSPAFIRLELKAKYRGKEKEERMNILRADLGPGGSSPSQVLIRKGLLEESEELRKAYQEEMGRYNEWAPKCGEQFTAIGKAKTGFSDEDDDEEDRWWQHGNDTLKLDRDGGPSKAIMDDKVAFGDKEREQEDVSVFCDTYFWYRAKNEADKEENEEDSAPIPAPVHPVVCIFTLMTHEFVETHITNLTPYIYDDSLAEKLVLPEDTRKLIDVLIGTASKNSEDLIRGKTGGVVILCSGAPGTGKTLTAEVYAEVVKKPLYTVQCSQLGVNAEELENELGRVLRRSVRWNAITLIDEADVYIHNRGTDVNQNAIVGVFLRLLEYYSGVLFLTTNRETVVDDAVRSRCMAHVRYKIADSQEDRFALWRILSAQYNVRLGAERINKLIEMFPHVSGRTIKQFCRLAQAMGKNRRPDPELFTWLAKFQDVEVEGEKK